MCEADARGGCETLSLLPRQCLLEDVLGSRRSRGGGQRQHWSIGGAIETLLCQRLSVRWVRFLVGSDAGRIRNDRTEAPGVLRVPEPVGPVPPPFRLEIGLHDGQVLSESQRRLLSKAMAMCAMIAEVDHRGHGCGSAQPPGGKVKDGAAPLIGTSETIRVLRDRIERVAATDFTVLVEGESGSGKELVARQIHELSARKRGPFVAVNCAALVDSLLEAELFGIEDRTATGVRGRKGKFEHAAGGTLFLDEVGDLSPQAQAKLLRAIQDCTVERVGSHDSRRIDTRLVAATNRHLRDMADQGLFRHDLYYRLSGVELTVPPLRVRREDVVELAEYFLARFRPRRDLRLTLAATDALVAYDWPGNVRELERLIEAVLTIARSDRIELEDLPAAVRGPYQDILEPAAHQQDSLRLWAGRYVRLVLQRSGYNKRDACAVLDISYHTLQTYLAQSGDARSRPGSPDDRPPLTLGEGALESAVLS
ncbi:MAG: sigma 54-interacting transcriptional regulator [Acidobacteriota bacterium]